MSDEDTEDRRRSALFMPPPPPDEGSAHLFLRDLGLGLGRLRDQLDVALADEGQSEAVAELLGQDQHSNDFVDDVVVRFVEHCAGELAAYGEAWFEVIRSVNDRPMLVSMPPYRFTSVGAVVVQHIPRAERERIGRRFVVLPRASVVRFVLPKRLGTPRSHLRLLRSIAGEGFGFPEFLLQRDHQVPFDFSEYTAIRDRYLARATRGWGWNEGLRSSDVTTDFFSLHRRLRFARSRSLLVEHVVSELNSLLVRHAIRATVSLKSELRPESFEEAAVNLSEGRLSLLDAVKVAFR